MKLSISEIFHSVQGEGPETGQPTVFVRLAGCNLKTDCPIDCDTKYAWSETEPMPIHKILDQIFALGKGEHHVTITGGEPLLQDESLTSLLVLLKAENYRLSLETNGSLDPPFSSLEYFDTIVVSPKTGFINYNFIKYINQRKKLRNKTYFKFVVEDLSEAKQALLFRKFTRNPIYLQPLNGDLDLARKLIEQLDDMQGVRFSFQIHKQIWGNVRGK